MLFKVKTNICTSCCALVKCGFIYVFILVRLFVQFSVFNRSTNRHNYSCVYLCTCLESVYKVQFRFRWFFFEEKLAKVMVSSKYRPSIIHQFHKRSKIIWRRLQMFWRFKAINLILVICSKRKWAFFSINNKPHTSCYYILS